jgi:hypothetical protein
MNQEDARAFIVALNTMQPYVPPMHFAQVTQNPMIKIIEQIANGAALKPKTVENEAQHG